MDQQQQPVTVNDVLQARVYVPRFIEKCAELGLPIQNQDDLTQALRISARLNAHGVARPQEQSVSLLKAASVGLDEHLGFRDEEVARFASDPLVKQAMDVIAAG